MIPAAPGQPLELGNVGDIVVRAADPEGEIAMHAAPGPRELVGERVCARGQRIGVGHFEHRGHAAKHGRARAGLQVLFMNETRLAKMHLGVDDAGKNMQAAAIDALAGRRLAQGADLGDSPVANANVALTDPSWLTTVPLIKTQSKLGGMAVLSCRGAKAAYLTVSALASPTGALPCTRKPPCSRIAASFP